MNATETHATSMGHVLSASAWLDTHFEACRDEYAEMLAWAHLEPGMSVLDAGCGTGSYVPLTHDAGATSIVALDTAVEHVATLPQRLPAARCLPVAGSITALPFAEASFDAVWCANTLQYVGDEDAVEAVREFARVVRPGGIVAVKDVDMTAFKIAPGPPFLGAHLAEACVSGEDDTPQSQGSIRGRDLYRLMQRAGLTSIRQRSFLIERFGPLAGHDARFWTEWLPYLAGIARTRDLPEEDRETWALVATPELAKTFVSSPQFYGCELQVVCTGRRPE
jgi:SAM-dependent methyltransferase